MSKRKLGFLLGALIGTGAGVLLAPKTGSETRKDVKKKMGARAKRELRSARARK